MRTLILFFLILSLIIFSTCTLRSNEGIYSPSCHKNPHWPNLTQKDKKILAEWGFPEIRFTRRDKADRTVQFELKLDNVFKDEEFVFRAIFDSCEEVPEECLNFNQFKLVQPFSGPDEYKNFASFLTYLHVDVQRAREYRWQHPEKLWPE